MRKIINYEKQGYIIVEIEYKFYAYMKRPDGQEDIFRIPYANKKISTCQELYGKIISEVVIKKILQI